MDQVSEINIIIIIIMDNILTNNIDETAQSKSGLLVNIRNHDN